jgi:hypothetical protein
MIERSKQEHDLALLYAFVNYMHAKSENEDLFQNNHEGIRISDELDFIHSLYMDALCEYSNYIDEEFDVRDYAERRLSTKQGTR